MGSKGVPAVLDKIAEDLLAVAAAVLASDRVGTNAKVGRNTLRESALRGDLEGHISRTVGDDPVIGAFFAHYVVFLEWTRPQKYGKRPPISALKGWAESNGIPTDARTLWAISNAIWRDGHAGRPIFATIDEELDGLFSEDWADRLLVEIINQLETFFND